MSRWTQTIEERFFAKVRIESTTGCWVWTACTNKGYGRFRGEDKTYDAYKWAYHHFIGPTPSGLVLDHLVCDNRQCVNPHHLCPTTNRETTIRGVGPAGVNNRKTHCDHGHEFTQQNTYNRIRDGYVSRHCKRCRADTEARRRVRLKCAGA